MRVAGRLRLPAVHRPRSPLTEPAYSGRRVRAFVDRVLAHYGTTCHLCGRDGANSADHVIPRSKGGAVWDLTNARPSHHKCNLRRGAQDLDAYLLANPHTLPSTTPTPLPRKDW